MPIIAVIGARGFVGSALCHEIALHPEMRLVEIEQGDDLRALVRPAEIVVHAANPSKRFWAQQHPTEDFTESVEKTAMIKKAVAGKKLVQISTMSARTQLDTVYGRHRRACELIIEAPATLIVRLGPMFGAGKNVGAHADLLANRPVFVAAATRYAYVDVAYNARKIIESLNRTGLMECGARNGLPLEELRQTLGSASTFEGPDDTQIPLDPPADAPDARLVIDYCLRLAGKI